MKNFNEFLTSKGLTDETFAQKEAGEMAGLYSEFNTLLATKIAGLEADKATKNDIQEAMDVLRNSQMEQAKSMNAVLVEMGLSIKASTEKRTDGVVASFVESIKQGLLDNKENLAKLKVSKDGEFVFKAVGDMTSGNVSGGNVPVEQRLAGFNIIASRRVRLLDLVSRGTALSNVISWVYQANRDGAAGQTTEGTTKNQIDFDLVVDKEEVVKTTAFIKISTEMLDDVDFIESEIRNELTREVLKAIESGCYSGAGTTNTLKGIRTVATAFAAGTFALAVDNANEVDVLAVAYNQIMIADQEMPTAILMHPSDVTKLKLVKVSSSDRRYVDRLQMIGGTLLMDGIQIVPTTLVAAGTYLIGDFTRALVLDKGSVEITMGLDGNDFTKNMRTIIAEWRGACIVKNNDRTAFVKGTFATDMAALETA